METSKQDAIHEKELAESLIRAKDYDGAREKLLRVRKLLPQLKHINPMITVCNILCAASNSQGNATPDWYWVLQTDAHSDKTRISAKYHSLVNSLQPIKNTFPGTTSALTVLHKAFSVLSDPQRRLLFDAQRFTNWSPSTDHSKDLVPVPHTPEKLTHDKRPIAVLKPGACYYDFDSNRKSGAFSKNQILAAYDDEDLPRRYARVNCGNSHNHLPFRLGVTWLKLVPANEDEKRWCRVGLPVACGRYDFTGSNMVVSDSTMFSHVLSRVQGLEAVCEICPKKGEVWAIFDNWRPFEWCDDPKTRKDCKYMMVEILMGYSKDAGVTVQRLSKVQGFKSIFQRCIKAGDACTFTIPANHLLKFSHNVPAFRFKGGEISGVSDGMLELDPLSVPDDLILDNVAKQFRGENSSDSISFTNHVPVSPPVISNPEIISMKCKWSRKDFTKDQVWAVYDGPDLMPRQYVIVNNVISGIEICTTFLDPHPGLDVELSWTQEDLPVDCGLFKPGRTTIIKMSQFSHVVSSEVCLKTSLYKIYPKKGEVWAVYKSWHPKWKNCDYKRHQCKVVEVLSDFCENDGVKVASLVEASDHMTFFQREVCNGFELVRTIPRMEMLSFSHQIPCFVISGIETHGLPEGTLHLEPDALPPRHPK